VKFLMIRSPTVELMDAPPLGGEPALRHVTTHCRSGSAMCSLRPMVGSATLTIARSAIVMKDATASIANARQRRTGFMSRLTAGAAAC
jgi:hypothetical protein